MSRTVFHDNVAQEDRKVFPLSLAQEGLLTLDQLEPDSSLNTLFSVMRIRRSLDVQILVRCFETLTQRHEALRTVFQKKGSQFDQVIVPTLMFPLSVVDLSHLPEQERELEAQRLASIEVQHPFDLEQGPLLRATLFHLAPQEALLLLAVHQVVVDRWSLKVFLSELSSLYEAFASDQPSPLPELPLQYSDFAIQQREQFQEEQFAEQLAYWEQHLAHMPETLALPMAHPQTPQPSSHGANFLLTLPRTLIRDLKHLSQESGVTLDMLFVAAFQILLYRYCGQEDLVIGTLAADRPAGTEVLVGLFSNLLVLRTSLSGDPSLFGLLARVRETVLGAQAHQELPFVSLLKALRPERPATRNLLFQVMISFDPLPTSLSEGWEPVALGNLTQAVQFDLSLEVQEGSQQVECRFVYRTDRFDGETIARLAGHWLTLLQGIVEAPDRPISTLPLLTEQERQLMLVEWNATRKMYPHEQSLARCFEAQVERTPHAIAVQYNGEQLTYWELNVRANQLAHLLHAHGVEPEQLVALLAERGIPLLVSILAVLKAGGAYLPLDPHHPAARWRRVIEHSQCSLVLTSTTFEPAISEALEDLPGVQRPALLFVEELRPERQSAENLSPSSTSHTLAYVIYTSGSTGMPKGAMIEQRGMLNHLYAKIDTLKLTSQDIVAQTASQCFDISVWQFLAVLLVGGCVRIYPDEVAHDPVQLLLEVESHRISILETVPSLLRAMLDAETGKGKSLPKLSALRWLIATGESLSVELCRHWLQRYPYVPLLNAYGPTECSDDVTHYPIDHAPDETRTCIPIGRAISNMRLYVLDRHLQPQPIGVSGELYVGGIGVGRGYLGDELRTREAFVPDPFSHEQGERLYKTGDLGRYLPDGTLEFLGRVDFQVKLHGFRIELGEIETVLRQHPAVREVAVLAREDRPGEQRLVAYVEVKEGQHVAVEDLKQLGKEQLPGYMVPSAVMIMEQFPLTRNGKLDRQALPVPEWSRSEQKKRYVAPSRPEQQQLVQIWEELLDVQPIGITDDFFELGGDSLLAARLFERIEQVSGQKLPLSTLLAGATIEQMAKALEAETRIDGRAPVIVVQRGGSRWPFFYLHGEWRGGGLYSRELARHLGPEQPFYLLEPYKFDGLRVPPTFEEVAAAHLEAMRRIQPEGPYFVSGYCNGALLAYEMARQMNAQGLEVGLLLLMDPDFPARHGMVRNVIRKIANVLRLDHEQQFEWFLCLQHVYRYLRFAHYRRSTDTKLMESGKQKKAGLQAWEFVLQALWPRIETLRQDWSNIYDWQVANYTPDLYPGKITFFWTSEEPWRSDGWQSIVQAKGEEVEVYINPGNHISGRTEYLPVLAERLRQCLSRAQAMAER
jgi:amino acid adenylation domain-containing protein